MQFSAIPYEDNMPDEMSRLLKSYMRRVYIPERTETFSFTFKDEEKERVFVEKLKSIADELFDMKMKESQLSITKNGPNRTEVNYYTESDGRNVGMGGRNAGMYIHRLVESDSSSIYDHVMDEVIEVETVNKRFKSEVYVGCVLSNDVANKTKHSDFIDEIEEMFLSLVEKTSKEDSFRIGVFMEQSNRMYARFETIKQEPIDLKLNYNDDFEDFSQHIINEINSKPRGITLFHGAPGTGKTSYIRHLCGLLNKDCIYVPPDMTTSLSNPGIIKFLMDYPNTVLIIEDAESILMKRDAGNNQAVANLLNMSDGLMGDIMRMQIICTFNENITEIDEAILRPGRLLGRYEFGKLKEDKADSLLESLGRPKQGRAMSLAEIYNEVPFDNNVKKSIGFM